MTVQFLTKMIQPHVHTIVRTSIGYSKQYNGTMYMVCDDTDAGTLASVNSRFYDEHEIIDWFFRDNASDNNTLVITIE